MNNWMVLQRVRPEEDVEVDDDFVEMDLIVMSWHAREQQATAVARFRNAGDPRQLFMVMHADEYRHMCD